MSSQLLPSPREGGGGGAEKPRAVSVDQGKYQFV